MGVKIADCIISEPDLQRVSVELSGHKSYLDQGKIAVPNSQYGGAIVDIQQDILLQNKWPVCPNSVPEVDIFASFRHAFCGKNITIIALKKIEFRRYVLVGDGNDGLHATKLFVLPKLGNLFDDHDFEQVVAYTSSERGSLFRIGKVKFREVLSIRINVGEEGSCNRASMSAVDFG